MSQFLALVRSGAGAFFEWWFGELAGLVPRALMPGRRRQRRALVLALEPDGASLLRGEQVIGRAEAAEPELTGQLRSLWRQARGRKRRLTVRLAAERGLSRRLDLPAAAKDDLDHMLRLEMDRLTPFGAEQVYSAHRIVSQDQRARRIAVELQVVPKAIVQDALEMVQGLGATVERVELGDRGGDGSSGLNLLPEAVAKGGGGRFVRVLAVLAIVLAVTAIAIPLRQRQDTVADLQQRVAAAKVDGEQSLALRDRLERLGKAAAFLVDAKTRMPMVSRVLAELTEIVPDQAYVAQLELRDGDLQLQGYAETASELIGLLEASPLFVSPHFRSPVTQDPRLGLERFHVAVELRGAKG